MGITGMVAALVFAVSSTGRSLPRGWMSDIRGISFKWS